MLEEMDSDSYWISRRQIFEDITFIKGDEGWSIELLRNKDVKSVYHWYSDTSFSINNMPLNEVEMGHLKSAVNILSQFKGMHQFEWMRNF